MERCTKQIFEQTNKSTSYVSENVLRKDVCCLLVSFRIVDNMPVTWCYDVEDGQKYCNPGFPIGCLVTTDGRAKDACVINVSSVFFCPGALNCRIKKWLEVISSFNLKWIIKRASSKLQTLDLNLSNIWCFIHLSVSVQQEEHILCVQPCGHQDNLPQRSDRRMERGSACCCHTGAEEVKVFAGLQFIVCLPSTQFYSVPSLFLS